MKCVISLACSSTEELMQVAAKLASPRELSIQFNGNTTPIQTAVNAPETAAKKPDETEKPDTDKVVEAEKKAPESAPVKPSEPEQTVTLDTLRAIGREIAASAPGNGSKGKAAMQDVAGVSKFSDVPKDKYDALAARLQKLKAEVDTDAA